MPPLTSRRCRFWSRARRASEARRRKRPGAVLARPGMSNCVSRPHFSQSASRKTAFLQPFEGASTTAQGPEASSFGRRERPPSPTLICCTGECQVPRWISRSHRKPPLAPLGRYEPINEVDRSTADLKAAVDESFDDSSSKASRRSPRSPGRLKPARRGRSRRAAFGRFTAAQRPTARGTNGCGVGHSGVPSALDAAGRANASCARHPLTLQSLNGTPGLAGCGASGLTRRSQLLVKGRPENALRTKLNASSNAALTPPLWVIPG